MIPKQRSLHESRATTRAATLSGAVAASTHSRRSGTGSHSEPAVIQSSATGERALDLGVTPRLLVVGGVTP